MQTRKYGGRGMRKLLQGRKTGSLGHMTKGRAVNNAPLYSNVLHQQNMSMKIKIRSEYIEEYF